MLKVEIKVTKVHDFDRGEAEVVVESVRGTTWNRERGVRFVPGDPKECSRTFILEDKERLVISGAAGPPLVYDKEQMAHISTAPPPEDLL